MFKADGQIRLVIGKSTLKEILKAEVSERLTKGPPTMVVDVSAVLWTLKWPAHLTVKTFISGFKVWLSKCLSEAEVDLCFDRYFDYFTKSTIRSTRAKSSRVHQLNSRIRLPARDVNLKKSPNKKQLNSLICEQILSDNNFLQNGTHEHKLVVSADHAAPTQVSRGCKTSRQHRKKQTSALLKKQSIFQRKTQSHKF